MAGDDGGFPANNAVELEAMRKEDFSWHPCQVSLCPSGVGLIVNYGENGLEDIIVNKEEAVSRLRIRSVPLQGDDCSEIQQGDHILATQQSESKNLFFDAEVEKALRVRHSKRVHCRCTFTIKWLHQELKETFIVSSSSIMKLATGNIISHPTISAFMNTVEPLICSSISTLSTVVNDMDDEMDLHDLLEKQKEEISNSADISKKTIAEDILFGLEVGTKGQLQCKTIAGSKISHIRPPSDRNQMMRSTRSRSKLQTEIEVKDPPQAAPSIGEELIESRSPLNPLAACAALASLMFKQPPNLEFSIHHGEEKSFSNSADITTNKEVTVEASYGTKSCISSVINYSIMSEKHSKIGGSLVPFVSKTGSVVKSLFSSKNEPRKPQLVDAYSDVMVKESKNKHTQEVIDNCSGLTCSITERKMCQPTTRLTRSASQKGIGISDDNINKKIRVGETKVGLAASRGRLTRSKLHLEDEFQNIETKKVMEENTAVKHTESDSSEKIIKDQGCYVLKDQNMFASQITVGVDLFPNQEIKRTVKKETSKMKYDTKRKTCAAEAKNSNNTKRLTRSALHAVLGNKTTEVTPVLVENEFSEHVNTDLSPGNVTDLVSNVLETKGSTSSPIYVDLTLPFTEETHGRNKRKMSGDFKVPEKTEENVAGNGESGHGKKKSNSSSKQELRFSPRLRLLAQTCSQDKF